MSEALWIALIVSILSTLSVWVKAYFEYKSKKAIAKKSKGMGVHFAVPKSGNPGYGERIGKVETNIENLEKNNEKDHSLIRKDITKIFNLLNSKK